MPITTTIIGADKLSLYNGALLELGERALSDLSEEREPRRLLDLVWDSGAVDYCLKQGEWKFAKRTLGLSPTPGIEPPFGRRFAYEKPDDFLKLVAISADEYMNIPLTQYTEEGGYWFTDVEPIYVTFVSGDVAYGGDYSQWSPEFVLFVEAYLAQRIAHKLTQDKEEWTRLFKLTRKRLDEARSADAREGPTVFPPIGAWVSARLGRRAGRRDRGPRGRLID